MNSFRCPKCGRPVLSEDLAPPSCPHCGSALPDLRGEDLAQRKQPRRPIMLTLAMAMGYGTVVVMFLSLLSALNPSQVSHLSFRGVPFNHAAFVAFQFVVILPPMVFLILASEALRRHLYESRRLLFMSVFAYFGSTCLMTFVRDEQIIAEAERLVGPHAEMFVRNLSMMSMALVFFALLLAYWYLFKKETTVAYYEALQRRGNLAEARKG